MKNPNLKLIAVAGLWAVASSMVVLPARASDEKSDAAARKAQREAEALKKYDANHDGKLDPEEKAARKADREKAKAEHAAKKRERAEREAEQESK